MASYFLKESVRIGHKQYHERRVLKRPFQSLEKAREAMARKELDDNQPFIEDHQGYVVEVGKKGKYFEHGKPDNNSGTE